MKNVLNKTVWGWLACLTLSLAAARTQGHFLFVVPEAGGERARVFLSEELSPDANVDAGIVSAAKLSLTQAGAASGAATPLALVKGESSFAVELGAGKGTRIVYGVADLGVRPRKDADGYRLFYHPKTILGDAFAAGTTLGAERSPVELTPVGQAGAMKLRWLVGGKPTPAAQVTVILPGGEQKQVVTDAAGETPAFTQTGRYGAWTKSAEPVGGETDGKRYSEARHYATLVIDIGPKTGGPKTGTGTVSVGDATPAKAVVSPALAKEPPLPEAVSSFGAVVCEGYLYVYGGHIAPTHSYSTEAVSGRFHRRQLGKSAVWEELAGGPALQGMNLATVGGKVYRIGGMQPHNKAGEPVDNYSTAECARFDPATLKWEPIAALPAPRSSHDVVALGGKLYVVGGWAMEGREKGNRWLGTMLVLDPAEATPTWCEVKQPFERRALIAASHGGKLYALGGFTEESDPQLSVEIFDPVTGAWSSGPALPGPDRNGFSPAACDHEGSLYVSVGDGSLCRLDDAKGAWIKVASGTPRIVHRLAPFGSAIHIVGGATRGANLDLIEVFSVGAR